MFSVKVKDAKGIWLEIIVNMANGTNQSNQRYSPTACQFLLLLKPIYVFVMI